MKITKKTVVRFHKNFLEFHDFLIISPSNTKSCTENEYGNKIQKLPEQNFDAYDMKTFDVTTYNRPHFGPFYR